MKFISGELIETNKELSDLDIFALEFADVIKKYTKYVIVSGYVSILLGRARVSEDIDMLIPKIDSDLFCKIVEELLSKGYYCLNSDNKEDMYDYLINNTAIRFAKNNTVIPNMEVKFAKTKIEEAALDKPLIVKINDKEIITSNLELQIAFKEQVLKSPKDAEDARHLRNIAEKNLNHELLRGYEVLIDEIY